MIHSKGKNISIILISFLCLYLMGCSSGLNNSEYDTVIVNGKVLDGSGNPWKYADIAIKDGRIVKVGKLDNYVSQDTINAKGLYVTSGFIDVHSHAGSGLTEPELSGAEPLLRQGITTVFINPDGGGNFEIEDQRKELLKDGIGVNVAQLIPHGSIRREVLGMEDRSPSSDELEQMKKMVKSGMEEGAFGLSSGPFYAPGSYAQTDELIELAKVAASYNGVYTSHIRDESNYTIGLETAVNEVIEIAREAKLPGIVTHIKALGPPVWGLSETIVSNIQNARNEGVEMFVDQYPYSASATGLISALVPRWAEEGGHDSLVTRLNNPELLSKIRSAMEKNLARRGGPDRIQFRFYEPDPSIEGKTLQELAVENDLSSLNMAIELIKKDEPGIVSFNMQDSDIHRFMKQSWTMTSSDGGLVAMGEGVPHPRNYGTYPRKIRQYVMEEKVIDLSSAIRSMTSLPALVFGLPDRGEIREGAIADIVVFDLSQIKSNATFTKPHQLSDGIHYLLVNGELSIQEEEFLDNRNGRVLNLSK